MPPTVAQLVDRPLHAGSLQGAALIGEAAGGARLTVRLGLWLDPSGRVVQARFRATTCASLIAYAEAACALAEREARPAPPMAERLRAEVAGVHPLHRDRAELVALALRRALAERPQPPPQPPPGGPPVNVAYVFSTPNASFILEKMIVPQLEEGRHGATVVGMFFFVDNNYLLVRGNPTGERLAQLSRKSGMLLMGCDQCCYQRSIADRLIEGIPIGCFPDLYQALAGARVDQVITL